MFIVIEGQDAAGKDTQATKLKEYFESQGKKVVTYSESGTTSDDPFVKGIAELTYGFSGLFKSDFHSVQTLRPMYGSLGISYRIKPLRYGKMVP